ncbi:MAG: sugar ABC transporter permease [Treponemataceae bacterium]
MFGSVKRKFFVNRASEYSFIIPAALFMLGFIVYPIIYNFVLSVNDIGLDFFSKKQYNFVGLKNYTDLWFNSDKRLSTSIINTAVFTFFSIIFTILISFSLALYLGRNTRISRFSRAMLVIAYIIPQTITALMFKYMFAQDGGIINYILLSFGVVDAPVGWLLKGGTAMTAIIATNVWISVPFNMLLFVAGLTTVDPEYIEAAMIDGAGWWRRLFSITIPCISETIKIVLTLGLIHTFKVFDLVYVITNGGPGNSTEMLSILSYRLSFSQNQYDDGAAVSNVLFIILMMVGFFYIKILNTKGNR